jgi:lipopolysaccharide export system protein LptA
MRKFLTAALLLVVTGAAAEELKITAQSFETDEKQGYTLFQGDVRVVMGSDEFNASKVTVYVDKARKPVKFVAVGAVSFLVTTKTRDTYAGSAQEMQFMPRDKEYRFYRDVKLKQLNRPKQINGDEVIVNLDNGRAFAKGADKKPVTMTFELDEEEQGDD